MTREVFYLSRDQISMTYDQILMTRELFYLSSDQILMTYEQEEAGV